MPDEVGPEWIRRWSDGVANGSATMSQRRLSSIERNGGVEAAVDVATARGVHLVRLVDEEGNVLVAASLHPFETLC